MSGFIDSSDRPVLLKAMVNGQDGYVVLPEGEDGDEQLTFTSREALESWTKDLALLVSQADTVGTYDDWYNA